MTKRTSIDQIESGDTFRVVGGSRAGSLGVKGSVTIVALEETTAQVTVSVGKFGLKFDVDLDMERSGDDVRITATGRTFDEIEIRATVVEESPTEIRLRDVRGKLADTHLVVADDGSATLDSQIPSIGKLHFLLEAE